MKNSLLLCNRVGHGHTLLQKCNSQVQLEQLESCAPGHMNKPNNSHVNHKPLRMCNYIANMHGLECPIVATMGHPCPTQPHG